MAEADIGGNLVKRTEEGLQIIPLVLRYLRAVDEITQGIEPDRGYLNVLVYAATENQPRLVILRHVAKYIDGALGIQDEIDLRIKDERL